VCKHGVSVLYDVTQFIFTTVWNNLSKNSVIPTYLFVFLFPHPLVFSSLTFSLTFPLFIYFMSAVIYFRLLQDCA
jgi:hypothetical protein